jgi:hypothetical protein
VVSAGFLLESQPTFPDIACERGIEVVRVIQCIFLWVLKSLLLGFRRVGDGGRFRNECVSLTSSCFE